jgi:hypothetical protein
MSQKDESDENHNQSKTKCPFCAFIFWNWHIKRHLQQHLLWDQRQNATQNDYQTIVPPDAPRTLYNLHQPNVELPNHGHPASKSWCPQSSSESADSSEDENASESYGNESDNSQDETDMFGEERAMSVDAYINNLTEKYDPQRVMKFLSWAPRSLTPIEKECVRFLRCLSFGAGTSRAHSQEWLHYVRDFGGALSDSSSLFIGNVTPYDDLAKPTKPPHLYIA